MSEILNPYLRDKLIVHATNEIVSLRSAELITQDEDDYALELDTIRESRIGWAAFISEMSMVPILAEGESLDYRHQTIELRIKETERLRKQNPSDGGLSSMHALDLVQQHAQKKALLVATGKMSPDLFFELSAEKQNDLYVSVDWAGDWDRNLQGKGS